MQTICQFVRDEEIFTLCRRGRHFELVSDPPTGCRTRQEWRRVPLEEIRRRLLDAGFAPL